MGKKHEGVHRDYEQWWLRPNRPLVIAAVLSVSMVLGTAVVQTIRSETSASSNRSSADDGGTAGGVTEPVGDPGSTPSPVPEVSPPQSAPPSAPPPPATSGGPSKTPSQPASVVKADHAITTRWAEGYIGAVTVTNPGSGPATWTVVIVLPAGASINPGNVWNATVAGNGRSYTFSSAGNVPLGPGGTVQFGYQATRSADNQVPESCKVNERACG